MSTSRRGFLKSVIAAVMLPPVVCRPAESAVQVAPKPAAVMVNPAWEKAEYEIEMFFHPEAKAFEMGMVPSGTGTPQAIKDDARYTINAGGLWVRHERYVEA